MINWWGAAAWLIGTLGVGGTIALLVFGGPAVGAILTRLWDALLRCVPCQLVLAIALGLAIGQGFGFARAAKQCRENELRAELAAKQRDIDNANQAAADADTRATTIAADAQKTHDQDEAYIDDLKKRPPSGACVLNDDDVRGLRESNPDRAGTKPAAGARLHGRR